MTFFEATSLDYLNFEFKGYDYRSLYQEILKGSNTSKHFAEKQYIRTVDLATGSNLRTPFISEDSAVIGGSIEIGNGDEKLISIMNDMLSDESVPNLIKLAFVTYLICNDSNRFYQKYRKYIIIPDSIVNTHGQPVNKIVEDFVNEDDAKLLSYYRDVESRYPVLAKLGRKTEYFFTQPSTSNIKDWLVRRDDILEGKALEIFKYIKELRDKSSFLNRTTAKYCRQMIGFGTGDGQYSDPKVYVRNLNNAKCILNNRIPESFYGWGVE